MKFTKNLSLGFKSYLESVPFIFTNGIWKYLIVPLVLFGIIFYVGNRFGAIADSLEQVRETGNYSWGWLGLSWVFLKTQFFKLLEFLFLDATKYLVMIFLSPLLAIISEKTEEILTGNKYKFNLKRLIVDVKRGIGIAIRMLIAEVLLAFVLWEWIVAPLFGVNEIIVDVVTLCIGFYFYGFAYVDYINERLRLTIKESWKFMKRHAGLAFAIGSVYSLFYKIPSLINTDNTWLNTLLDNFGVLFAPVLAIVAATIAMHKLVDLNNSKFAEKKENSVTTTEI
ncbi:MAG: EI24 domain-containing protein, partial [Flavobacteriales bacterium]